MSFTTAEAATDRPSPVVASVKDEYAKELSNELCTGAKQSSRTANVILVLALCAAAGGVAVILLGEETTSEQGLVSSILLETIGVLLLYMHSRAMARTSEYHQRLIFIQNVRLAKRMTSEMEGSDKVAAERKLIDQLSENIIKPLL